MLYGWVFVICLWSVKNRGIFVRYVLYMKLSCIFKYLIIFNFLELVFIGIRLNLWVFFFFFLYLLVDGFKKN